MNFESTYMDNIITPTFAAKLTKRSATPKRIVATISHI